jgi:hypothetical protein
MPKNTQGGSKHKKGSNSESSTSKKNKKLFDNLLTDIRGGDDIDGILVGLVIKRLGDGRMEVDYISAEDRLETVKARMKGSIRGRGKKDAWVDVGSYVVINETGVEGTLAFEIVMPLTPDQVKVFKKEGVISEHLAGKELKEMHDGIEFEERGKKEGEEDGEDQPSESEINIDNI